MRNAGHANLIPGSSNPLSQDTVNRIVSLYSEGAKYREIEIQIGRSIGTVKTAIRRLQIAGIIVRRYSVAEWVNV